MMMRNRFLLFILCTTLALVSVAQPGKVYRSLSAVKNPDDVYILRLRREKLTQIPAVIFTFTNLRELDLSKNNLQTVPPEIVALQNLEVLNLGRNNIDSLPIEVAQLSHLRELDLSRNPVEHLPEEMGYMLSLERLVLWSTPMYSFPVSFSELDGRLRYIDLRSCLLTRDEQDSIRALLPSPKIVWDQACNCK